MSAEREWSKQNPDGDLTPVLERSIAAAKRRHPSGRVAATPMALTAADRCDACPAAAQYRVTRVPESLEQIEAGTPTAVLDFCGHHFATNALSLSETGWLAVIAPEMEALS